MRQFSPLLIGSRGSKLALAQTELVRAALKRTRPDLVTEVVRISTTGDLIQNRPLREVGGKALFVEEIESALREGRIHMAVHSGKDIPSDLPTDMRLAACLPRADARDVLISRVSDSIATLPSGAIVGTSSPRRECQLRSQRADVDLRDIRGNVDTRLEKLQSGQYDAIVLAAAGLSRLNLLHHVTEFVSLDVMLPCVAQGAIALEVCANDEDAMTIALGLDHAPTSVAVSAERAFLAAVGGTCDTPLAAHALLNGDRIDITGMIGHSSGRMVHATITGPAWDAVATGTRLGTLLMAQGGSDLLRADPQRELSQNASLR